MQINYKMKYTEVEIPKGCRKARDVSHEENITIEIRDVKPEDAPVVLIGTFKTYSEGRGRYSYSSKEDAFMDIDYRWFEGSLWMAYEFSYNDRPKLYPLQYEPYFDSWTYRSSNRLQMLEKINGWSQGQIIIDGQVYKKSGEPVYEFGDFSGYNHFRDRMEYGSWLTYNHLDDKDLNDSSQKFFRLDEFDLAFSKLKPPKSLRKNGDEKEVVEEPFNPDIKARFKVLVPSILRMNKERFWSHELTVEILSFYKVKIRTKDELLKAIAANPEAVVVTQQKRELKPRKYLDERLSTIRAREGLNSKESQEIEDPHEN